uniref:Uncharacterized protein n=1 Tax=Avena sativa TaxID=4498 RepID=A0ACD5YSQ2_AVESA
MPPHASPTSCRRSVYLLLAVLAVAPFLLFLLYGGASQSALCRSAHVARRITYPSVLWSRVPPIPGLPSSPLPDLRASHWIIFSASPHHARHRPLAAVPGWQLLAVADEATPPDWSHPGAALLTLVDQARLGFRSVAFLPDRGHARKVAAYLFAVQRGARVVYDADARNAVADNNLTRHFDVDLEQRQGEVSVLLQYSHADPNRTVVNPYVHFGQPSVWPRGLPLDKAGEVGTEEFYTEVFGGAQFIQQGLCNGLPDVDAVFYFTRKSLEMEAFDVRFDADAPKVALPQGLMAPVFDRFAGAEGFVFLQDHMVLNYWNLLDADKSKLWITNKVKDSWSGVPLRRNNIEWFRNQGDMVKKAVGSFPFRYQDNYKRSVAEDTIIHCSSEIFYVPRQYTGHFSNLVKVIGNLDIHHTVAVPMLFLAMDLPSNFEPRALGKLVYMTNLPSNTTFSTIYTAEAHAVYPMKVQNEMDFVSLIRVMASGDPFLTELI